MNMKRNVTKNNRTSVFSAMRLDRLPETFAAPAGNKETSGAGDMRLLVQRSGI
jgi:hypothetical protein